MVNHTVSFSDLRSVKWEDGAVVMVDQNRLPDQLAFIRCLTHDEVAEKIRSMAVRGAPAIGVAAAMGLALAAFRSSAETPRALLKDLESAKRTLESTRPTAVNLFWALDRVMNRARRARGGVDRIIGEVVEEADRLAEEDVAANRSIGEFGAALIGQGDTVLTHCNTGSLATVSYGTALGVIRSAFRQNKMIKVMATETRPRLQGARLTILELLADGIPATLITDGMVGYVMENSLVDEVVVGADRILGSGHILNKVGTYTISVLARSHGVPFYVAAPTSTFDLSTKVDEVVIEHRSPMEVLSVMGVRIAPEGAEALNPAFDITPPENVTAIITERGVIHPPYGQNIPRIVKRVNRSPEA